MVGHNEATGRAQQSEDFLLDTHRAVAVELETPPPPPPNLSMASEVPAPSDEITSNDVSAQLRGAAQPADSELESADSPALPPRKIDMLADNQQFSVLFAVSAAVTVFLFVLALQVYLSCRHSDVLSYPRANMDIFSLKPSKESAIDCSRLPEGKSCFFFTTSVPYRRLK